MAWVAVESNGDEYIFLNKPKRDGKFWSDEVYETFDGQGGRLEHSHYSDIQLPKGSE